MLICFYRGYVFNSIQFIPFHKFEGTNDECSRQLYHTEVAQKVHLCHILMMFLNVCGYGIAILHTCTIQQGKKQREKLRKLLLNNRSETT